MHKTMRTRLLEIAYLESGPPDGVPVILLHGWPSDVHDWDGVAPALAAAAIACWCRGCAATARPVLDPATPRSGQQAALGADVRDFMDALGIGQAVLAGYDWGGRAACVVAALWPERVRALVTINGYAIQNIAACGAAGIGRTGTSLLVPMVFPYRARPCRPGAEPARDRAAAVAAVVAELAVRRCDVRGDG